jgi:hypothetical protein
MANFITTSITKEGKQNYEALIAPMIVGKSPLETQGVQILGNVQSGQFLNLFSRSGKKTIAYAKGFSAGSEISTYTRREIVTYQMKAEAAQDANEFIDTIYEELQGKGIDWNDIDKAGKILKDIIIEIWMSAVQSDIFRQFWFSDTDKEVVTSGFKTGAADVNYNSFDGMWTKLIANASTTLSTSAFWRTAFNNNTTAQITTLTMTGGSSSNLIVLHDGTNYSVAYNANYDTTAADFVTAHATTLGLRGVTPSAGGSDTLVFTSAVSGQPFATTFAATSTITGTEATGTPNVAAQALADDEAIGKLQLLHTGVNTTLKAIPTNQKVFLVTHSVYENYLETLEGKSATALTWTSEDGRQLLINGAAVLIYRGIPVVKMDWDSILSADFVSPYPHRIVYTTLDNLVLPLDARSDFARTEAWYNKDEQENRFRTQYRTGADYKWFEYTAIAY